MDDLIVACTSEQKRRLLGIPQDYGPVTICSYTAGVEKRYNSWDTLAGFGELGRAGTNPLIIRVSAETRAAPSYWRISGSIAEASTVKGIRCRVYQKADFFLGYYEGDQPAIFYKQGTNTLLINMLFKSESDALHFDCYIRSEANMFNSPLSCLQIVAHVEKTTGCELGRRIQYSDYIPTDSESPQDTLSMILGDCSLVDLSTEEFTYQRIESHKIFGEF